MYATLGVILVVGYASAYAVYDSVISEYLEAGRDCRWRSYGYAYHVLLWMQQTEKPTARPETCTAGNRVQIRRLRACGRLTIAMLCSTAFDAYTRSSLH
jgi:hypothetical protein